MAQKKDKCGDLIHDLNSNLQLAILQVDYLLDSNDQAEIKKGLQEIRGTIELAARKSLKLAANCNAPD